MKEVLETLKEVLFTVGTLLLFLKKGEKPRLNRMFV